MMIVKRKKPKKQKKFITRCKIMFENYTDCLFNEKTILKSQQKFKSYLHVVLAEELNKIALSSNDDKRLHTFDRATTYPHGTDAFKVFESEMMMVKDFFLLKIQRLFVLWWNNITKITDYVNINDQFRWLYKWE